MTAEGISELTPEAFRERFALATFPDGGVVVDLKTGSYSRLNASGAAVLEELERARRMEDVVNAITDRLHIASQTAAESLSTMLDALSRAGIRREPPDPFRYRPSERGGYDVWHGETLGLHVDESGRTLTLVSPAEALPLRVYDYVSGIAPKLLFLRGMTVLHGSSCDRGGTLLGICGKSRAGKTTTAKTLARHGCALVSEDLLVFAPDLSKPKVYTGGEKRVDQWAREAAAKLAAGPGASAGIDDLLSAASGATIPLGSLWFLDAARRGETLRQRALGKTRTLGLIVANHFLGAGHGSTWRRHLSTSHAIASTVAGFEVDVPKGLDCLDEAIATYTTNSAS